MRNPVLGLLLGDCAGVGPEILVKALATNEWKGIYSPLVIGSERIFLEGMNVAGQKLPYSKIGTLQDVMKIDGDGIVLLDKEGFDPGAYKYGEASVCSGKCILEMLRTGVELWREGVIGGFSVAPLNKAVINMADSSFSDELQVMRREASFDGLCLEMNYAASIWTSRVTGHIPLSKVGEALSVERIADVVRLTSKSLETQGKSSPVIFVSALNPHGGEGGIFGNEEIEIITPAIELVRKEGLNVAGPYPADTVFYNAFKGNCDAVVTMYHDQGQIALKTLHFGEGATFFAGLPFIVTTPAHGVAYDVAGRGIANESSMRTAMNIAASMLRGHGA